MKAKAFAACGRACQPRTALRPGRAMSTAIPARRRTLPIITRRRRRLCWRCRNSCGVSMKSDRPMFLIPSLLWRGVWFDQLGKDRSKLLVDGRFVVFRFHHDQLEHLLAAVA